MIDAQSEPVVAAIHAARNYVQPSDDLRPQTLEAARRACGDMRAEKKLGGFALALLLIALVSSPAVRLVNVVRSNKAPTTSSEIQQRALLFSEQPNVGSHWGMAEAFSQLRRVQAAQLGHGRRSLK